MVLLPSVELYKKYEFKDPEVRVIRVEMKKLKASKDPKVIKTRDAILEKMQKRVDVLIMSKLDLREACNSQIQDSTAFKMYFDTLSTKALAKAEEETKSKDFGE